MLPSRTQFVDIHLVRANGWGLNDAWHRLDSLLSSNCGSRLTSCGRLAWGSSWKLSFSSASSWRVNRRWRVALSSTRRWLGSWERTEEDKSSECELQLDLHDYRIGLVMWRIFRLFTCSAANNKKHGAGNRFTSIALYLFKPIYFFACTIIIQLIHRFTWKAHIPAIFFSAMSGSLVRETLFFSCWFVMVRDLRVHYWHLASCGAMIVRIKLSRGPLDGASRLTSGHLL